MTSITIEDYQPMQDVHVVCKDCGAKVSFYGIRYTVADRWNMRPIEKYLEQLIENQKGSEVTQNE